MADESREQGVLVTVVAAEEPHLVVAKAAGVRDRVPSACHRTNHAAEPRNPRGVLLSTMLSRVRDARWLTV
jgi:hypothetical protein